MGLGGRKGGRNKGKSFLRSGVQDGTGHCDVPGMPGVVQHDACGLQMDANPACISGKMRESDELKMKNHCSRHKVDEREDSMTYCDFLKCSLFIHMP